MSSTADPLADFENGHFHSKGSGDTLYRGPLTSLPEPRFADHEAAAEAMFSDGCVLFPNAMDAGEVAALRHLMDTSGGPDSQYEMKNWCFNKHLEADFHKDPRLLGFIDRPGIVEVVEAILGEGCRATGGSLWITGKGRAMGMHIDALPVALPEDLACDPRVRMPIFTCTVQFYLDDQAEDIGATLVIPGSHRSGRAPANESTWQGRAPQMVGVKAGGAVLFRPDLWHGAAMNSGTRRRHIMQVHYGHASVAVGRRPEDVSPEVLAVATPRQRRLLGLAEAPVQGYPKQDPKRAA